MPLYNPPATLATTTDIDIDEIVATSATLDGAAGLVLSGNGGKDTLNLSDTTADVGITIGGDVDLYRPAAERLRIDVSELQISTSNTTAAVNATSIYGISFVAGGRYHVWGDTGAGFIEFNPEQSVDPSAPAANAARLFIKDSGGGKTQLAVRFASGATQIIATEP